MRLKKGLFAFITAVVMAAILAVPAQTGGGDEFIGKCDCAITVAEAHSADKVSAIENAMAKIKDGIAPGETEYFSEKAIRRSLNDGYYTVCSTGHGLSLNVSVDGVDNDYGHRRHNSAFPRGHESRRELRSFRRVQQRRL